MAETKKSNIPVDSNIFEKIQWIKEELLEADLKKSGYNKFADFKYYELADFLPTIIRLCNKIKLFTKITYENEKAFLKITNITNPDEYVMYCSPMEDIDIKGCNKMQSLGGIETYSRRYLYMSAFDITENDMFDSVSGKDKTTEIVKATENQLSYIKKIFANDVDNLKSILNSLNKKKIDELTLEEASDIIKEAKNNEAYYETTLPENV